VIRRFRAELARMGIHCERVLLFGSQALGTAIATHQLSSLWEQVLKEQAVVVV